MQSCVNISEIFYSILGESTEQGLPCAFIRVAGCNLRCSYCDTIYAQKGGKEYPVEKILSTISDYPVKLVEITGGEPLLQENIHKLIRELIKRKYKVLIETNGSLDIGRLPAKIIVIMDIKCPSSKMHNKMNWENIKKLKVQDEIKFVLSDLKDYIWAKKVIKKYNLSGKKILLSPVLNKLSSKKLSKWILKDGLNARLHLQLHKIIGVK
ncbi:MAG: radical SAM protein [Candidatus Omnitrophota bacterium]